MPTIIPFPALVTLAGGAPQDFSGWRTLSNTRTFVSPLTSSVQTLEKPGARWKFGARFVAVAEPDRGVLDAFFARLDGAAVWFAVHDWTRPAPLGAARLTLDGLGPPIVAGAGQAGRLLNISGCPASVAGWLLPGDMFSVNGECKRITEVISTSGVGTATLAFAPPVRRVVPDASPILLAKPLCQFAATAVEGGGDNVRAVGGKRVISDYALDAIEVWVP